MRRTQCSFCIQICPNSKVDHWSDHSLIYCICCTVLMYITFPPFFHLYMLMLYLHLIAFKVLWVINFPLFKRQALNADVVLQGGTSGRVHTCTEILQTRFQLALANEREPEWDENKERRHNCGWKALGVIHQIPLIKEVWHSARRGSLFWRYTFSWLWISPEGWQISSSGDLKAWAYVDPKKRRWLLSHQSTP